MPRHRRDSACSLRKEWAGALSPRDEKCASNGKGFSKISFTNRYYLVLTLKQLIFCRFNQNIFPKILDSPKPGKWPFWTAVLSVFTPCLHQWTDSCRQGSCPTRQDYLCSRLPACFPKQQAEALLSQSPYLSQRSSCPLKIFCIFYFLGTWDSLLNAGSPAMNIWKCWMGLQMPGAATVPCLTLRYGRSKEPCFQPCNKNLVCNQCDRA